MNSHTAHELALQERSSAQEYLRQVQQASRAQAMDQVKSGAARKALEMSQQVKNNTIEHVRQ